MIDVAGAQSYASSPVLAPGDFNELHVAKISLFATSALTTGKQPLSCMGQADLCVSGEGRFNLAIQWCARGISDAVIQSRPCCERTSSQFAETHASPVRSQGRLTLRGPRLLLPRSQLKRSDFALWSFRDMLTASSKVRVDGEADNICSRCVLQFDPQRSFRKPFG